MNTKIWTQKIAPGTAQCRTFANYVSHYPELLNDFIRHPVGDAVASRDLAAGYVFQLVESLYSDAGEPPNHEAVLAAIPVEDMEGLDIDEVADIVHSPSKLPSPETGSRRSFDAFVRNILAYGAAADLCDDLDSGRPVAESIDAATTAAHYASLAGRTAKLLEPVDWRENKPLEKVSTGLTFIDMFLGGGTVGGEVYGLLGPMGSCKTTLARQLTTEAALGFAAKQSTIGNDKFAAIVSYEADLRETQVGVFGYAAQIPRSRLEETAYADLSTSANPAPYEHRLLANSLQYSQQAVKLGEQERLDGVVDLLDDHMAVLDMTGQSDHPEHGMGGINEIAGHIADCITGRSQQCGLIVIDYVGAMVKRQLEATSGFSDIATLRHAVGLAASEAKHKLARQFDCPVWLVHQMSGEAAARSSAAKLDHTDAAESAGFAENLDFAFVTGKPNTDSRASFRCTKHRRRPPRPSTVIQILGNWGRVVEATGYGFHPRTGQIIAKNHLASVGL